MFFPRQEAKILPPERALRRGHHWGRRCARRTNPFHLRPVPPERTHVFCLSKDGVVPASQPLIGTATISAATRPRQVRFLLCIGNTLVSLCDEGRLKAWNLKHRRTTRAGTKKHRQQQKEEEDVVGAGEGDGDGGAATCDAALEGGFVPTALAHPPTYLNKVLVGSEGGALQLWNVRTGRWVLRFVCGCGCMQQRG